MKRTFITICALLPWLACAEPTNGLSTLSVPALFGDIVVQFSTTNDFAHAYTILGAKTSSPGKTMDLTRGSPADLVLQLDESGKAVLCLNFGGFYMSNPFSFTQKPDGTIITNTPRIVLNGATQSILTVWQSLSKTNRSFRLERLKTGDDPTTESTVFSEGAPSEEP